MAIFIHAACAITRNLTSRIWTPPQKKYKKLINSYGVRNKPAVVYLASDAESKVNGATAQKKGSTKVCSAGNKLFASILKLIKKFAEFFCSVGKALSELPTRKWGRHALS